MIIFDQQNYSGELGTGHGATIHDFGCALVSVAMDLVNVFGKQTDPNDLNQKIINVNGYAPNGTGANDELEWGCINQIYSDITLAFNNMYSGPADMTLIDGQLSKSIGVIVGVSFEHNPAATQPDHYVLIYKKNADGSYQMLDPWFGDDTSFNARYVVNGIANPAQAICQAVSYNGTVVANPGYYKGIDLTNTSSVEAAIDTWYEVTQGQFVSLADVNSICTTLGIPTGSSKDAINAAIAQLQKDKAQDDQTVTTLNQQLPALKTENETLTGQVKTLTQQVQDAQAALTEPKSGLAYKDLYNQAESDLSDTKKALAKCTTTLNQSQGQISNTNYTKVGSGVLFGELLKRLFHVN